MLDMLGLRDYAAYMKGTRSVSIYLEDHTIEITPRHNVSSRHGFTAIMDENRTLTDEASAETLGTEILAAFDKAT